MAEEKPKQKLAEIARTKRYLYLIEKIHSGKPLSNKEINELEIFEKEPQSDTVVKSAEEVAEVMDVSERTIYRWRNEGMPVTKDGFYDLEQIRIWVEEKEKASDESGKAFWEAKIRKYKATLLEIDLKKAQEELVSKEEVEKGEVARIVAVKRAFLAVPTRMAPLLAMKEPREIEALLYEEIGEIIDEFAGVRNEDIDTRQNDLEENS